jgi:hypothetical protein
MDQMRTCAICGASFCINEWGRYVVERGFAATWLGRRLTSGVRRLHLNGVLKAWKSRTAKGQAAVSEQWLRLPRTWRWLISVGGGGCLAILAVSLMFSSIALRDDTPKEQSESLHVRAEVACQALLLGDNAVLDGLATRDTRDETHQWMNRVRPGAWPRSADLARTAQVDLRVLFKSLKTQRAAVYYEIRTATYASQGAAEVEGTLCWMLGHDGRWLLDGRRTLDELSTARRTD